MQASEVLAALRDVVGLASTPPMQGAVMKAAITHLTPEPITEAALRAEGFEEFAAYFNLSVTPTIDVVYWRSTGVCEIRTACLSCIEINITTMQRLREVIAALEGDVRK